MTRLSLLALLGIILINRADAQDIVIQQEFSWTTEEFTDLDSSKWKVPSMQPGDFNTDLGIPVWSKKIELAQGEELTVKDAGFWIYENITDPAQIEFLKQKAKIQSNASSFSITYSTDRKVRSGWINIPGIIKETDGTFKRLEFVTITASKNAPLIMAKKGPFSWKSKSVLNQGKWAKITVTQNGVYAMNYAYLSGLGLPVNGIELSKIRIYGYPAGMLPEANAQTRFDDLEELAIKVLDNNQNSIFDEGDQVLFYGQYVNPTVYDAASGTFYQRMHLYATAKAYFVTVGDPGGKRIQTQNSSNKTPTHTTSSFDEVIHHEVEKVNLLKSGKLWLGESFDRELEYSFTENLPGQVGTNVILSSNAVARSQTGSVLTYVVNGNVALNQILSSVPVSVPNSQYFSTPATERASLQSSSPLNIVIKYTKPAAASKAWLNYYYINYRRSLATSGQLIFRDHVGIGAGAATRFNLVTQGLEIWEITDPLNVSQMVLTNNGFTIDSDSLREFAAYLPGQYLQPAGQEVIANQNLHELSNVDYVIVANPNFNAAANRLADFHRAKSNLNVVVVSPQQVYNEFSSGTPDLTAIRNMMRMLYDKAAPGKEPRYLLLFGDASYDYKDIKAKNTNFVPTFQSENSDSPVGSFCADDFFGLLDETEGLNGMNGSIDIGIGRLPVQTATEADNMVTKIISYYDVSGFGEWRNNVVYVADDQDGNTHMEDAEIYAGYVDAQAQPYNVRKVYADAYKQVTVGNGQRYPDVTNEINRAFTEGSLIVNYSGHGGETQLGDERYVDIPQINGWESGNKLPLFVTATCEFTRYDDPDRQSAGELVQLNKNGGSIALYTTVRLVYSFPNRLLNTNLYNNNVFSFDPDNAPALGDVFRNMKNATNTNIVNTRSFALIGDPAVKLAYPKHNVVTTSVTVDPGAVPTDTLKALSKVTISGQVEDKNNLLLSGFNGKVFVTVFGSKQVMYTLGNDPDSPVEPFNAYKSIVYKGTATVKNGLFSLNFVMPQELPLQVGIGKISYYAENGVEDASGHEFIHMSPDMDANANPDFSGPSIRLFMNDTNFVFGGLTDQNPSLLALVYDESGINTTGIGIGRDIVGVIDNDSRSQLILNNYYTASTDDFKSGTVSYPLSGLAEGRHSVKIKVWDVNNNSAEAYTEFVVANSIKLAVENLLNYPNPFYDSTTFYFEHNQQGKNLSVEIYIYETNGTHVRTLTARVTNAGATFNNLSWDAKSLGSAPIKPGLYMYRVVVKTDDGQEVQQSQRLVYMPK